MKVLAAVAAPDETKTKNQPLDTEAEMQAVLDAVAAVAGQQGAQVRILEVASLPAIRQALEHDSYHVLHLSAHGSPDSVGLEDEDGNPVLVTARSLMDALQHAGKPVPLIVLSSCSGGATGSDAMAAGLIARGADRVIAMLAPVRAVYATMLTRYLYEQLATRPALTAGQALARARYLAEEQWSQTAGDQLAVPQYGLPTLLTRAGDAPLTDPAAARRPLAVATAAPGGGSVRELPMGILIGRRTQLRAAMSVLRGTSRAVQQYGVSGGVVLTGIGGIGKTALAGRVMSRLRDEGWLIAVHEGRWNPTALITATAQALTDRLGHPALQAGDGALRDALTRLTDPGSDDGPKLAAITGLIAHEQLLVVLDDFEQNLSTGGEAFLDPVFDDVVTALADAARAGKLLITCRYPLPGPDRFLIGIPVPPLSAAELRRMFLRLPQLADLPPTDQLLLIRSIGGHPRLIEFTDALLRGGRSSLRHVQDKLRGLAHEHGINVRHDRPVAAAIDQAMIIGSADILLGQLLTLLTPQQADIVAQAAISRAPMTLGDLAFTLTPAADTASPSTLLSDEPAGLEDLRGDTTRLADLTLLTPGPDIVMHPWTAELITRNTPADTRLHERALAMRQRRFAQQRGTYEDLLDIPRHLAALHRWDDVATIAGQAVQIMPGTLAAVAYLTEIRPLVPPAERAWALITDHEIQALLSAGNLAAATRQLQAVHHQLQTRAAADPGNCQWQRDLSVSHLKFGDVAVAVGDLAEARGHFQASRDIRLQLVAADPANRGWQRDLSVSHNRLGDVALLAGDMAAARSHYQAGLDLAEQLVAADPGNSGWKGDLSASHEKLGDVAVNAKDLPAARGRYRASLDILSQLVAADPGNGIWQRNLSVSHNRLGDMAAAAGDMAAARSHYQAGLDLAEQLVAADPGNRAWQRDLSISHVKLGDVAVNAKDLPAARGRYRASLDILSQLVAADPGNGIWQGDLSISHLKLGDVAGLTGDMAAARGHYQAGLDLAEQLVAADPGNSVWRRTLLFSHRGLGNVAGVTGELAAARSHYRAGLDIAEQMAAANPGNSQWQRDLSEMRHKIANLAEGKADT